VVYAAGSDQQALDRVGDHDPNGLFMREFLKAMRKPGLKAQDVVREAKQTTIEQAGLVGYRQSPAIYDHSVGIFYFSGAAADGRSVVSPAPIARPSGGGSPSPGSVFRDCPDCPEMVVVPAGSFVMGSSAAETTREGIPDVLVAWERPQHRVTISRAFALSKYPVTQGEFAAFVGDTGYDPAECYLYRNNKLEFDRSGNWRNPGFEQSEDHPVVCVSYEDAKRYVSWLNEKVGRVLPVSTQGDGPYRLPSEAEWEYAARAGTTSARWWGEDIGSGHANCHGCGSQWDGKQPSPVASFRPNPFGLFDVLGNVFQWTEDCGHWSYVGARDTGEAWPAGDCGNRVARGGSWVSSSKFVRSANRQQFSYKKRMSDAGFRLARTLP